MLRFSAAGFLPTNPINNSIDLAIFCPKSAEIFDRPHFIGAFVASAALCPETTTIDSINGLAAVDTIRRDEFGFCVSNFKPHPHKSLG